MHEMHKIAVALCLCGLLWGCQEEGRDRDMDQAADVGMDQSDAGQDMADQDLAEVDLVQEDMADLDMAPEGPCQGDCRAQTLEATFGEEARGFTRAYYGLEAPSEATGGQWLLYLEAHAGGAEGCPEQESPTPWRTLILSGLALPLGPVSDQGSVVVLDFRGDLLPGDGLAPARSTQASVTLDMAQLCMDCLGMPAPSDPEGFVALELEATMDMGGQVRGHVFATHCDSLDLGP